MRNNLCRYVYVLTTDPPRDLNGYSLLFDSIIHISKDGDNLGVIWSSFEHKSELDKYYTQPQFAQNPNKEKNSPINEHKEYEYFHINTIHILENNSLEAVDPRFQAGNIMLCLRNVDLIVILDKDSWNIVWAWGPGVLDWPHMPSMLSNGNILIFDNGPNRGYSRILEINPLNLQYVWQYPPENDPSKSFISNDRGSCLRLSNGNTLIGISEKARSIEVTPDGEIVWEFLNPIIKNGRRQIFYRMMRYPADMFEKYF